MTPETRNDEARIYRQAENLALTGKYEGWMHIELALKNAGIDARRILASRAKRHWLDTLCVRHWKDPRRLS